MAMLPTIDTNEYERQAPSGAPLPPGVYTMTVVRVTQKHTKDTTGVYVEVEFDIQQQHQFSNRKFWDRFNIINKSAEAQRIGRECFSDLCKACGISGVISDDDAIMGKTVQGRLSIDKSSNPQYEDSNRCKKYYPVGVNPEDVDKGAKANAPKAAANNWNNAGAPQAASQQVAPATATPPWKRQ